MSDENDDKFSPKQNIEEDVSDDEKYLNKGAANVPSMISYSLTIALLVVGFVAGAMLIGGFVTSLLCMVQTMSTLLASPAALQSVEGTIQSYAIDETVTCAQTLILTPLPILASLFGGVMGAYPAYRISEVIKSSGYLKSIV